MDIRTATVDSLVVDTTVRDPLVGRILDERYEVVTRVARGGMATVYRARDLRLDREVALKILHAHLSDDPSFSNRFIREARSAAQLSHPNVVQVFDQGNDGDLLYLAMEFLPGLTLRQVLAQRKVLTPREAFSVLDPIIDALGAAHRAGIIHRDVKPENVILADDGRIKVADFGLAKVLNTNHSSTGVLMGTVAYLSPELVEHGIADTRSDVYATGIVAFELFTGRQPFTGDSPVQVAYRHVHESVPAPSTVAPELPDALDRLVLAATARDPQHRPADAGALLDLARETRGSLPESALDLRPTATGGSRRSGTAGSGSGTGASSDSGSDARTAAPAGAATTQIVGAAADAPQNTQALPLRHRIRRSLPTPPGPPGRRDSEHDELARHRRNRGIVALVGVLALALVLALGAWKFTFGAYQAIPGDLAGQSLAEVEQYLKVHGLGSEVRDAYDDTAEPGTVLRTDPGAGEKVHNHGTVIVYVCRGPAEVTIPKNLIGMSEGEARAALTRGFLDFSHDDTQYNDDVPLGHVISTSPAPGTTVPNGTQVTLLVSNGPFPVTVPNVTNKPLAEATAQLDGLGLKVNVTWEYNDTVPAGSVIRQNPTAGSTSRHKATVTLVVSQVPVPDVIGKREEEARQILEDAGYTVQVDKVLGGVFGVVRGQNPGGGTRAPRGSTVTISVV